MKIALLGDIALIGSYSCYHNTNLIKNGWGGVSSWLSKNCDYVVGNLETPFSYERKSFGAKSAFLCSEPENIELLKMLHVNAVTLANNHMFDFGKEGYELTKTLLKDAGIDWFGAEGREHRLVYGDNKLVFTGWCCYSSNPQGCVNNGQYGLNEFDLPVVEERMKQNNLEGWLNITSIHAGIEHVHYPSIETIKVADKLTRICPFIYYGHHPHVAQPVEFKENNSLIAYSLGNFCFDDVYSNPGAKKPLVELTEDNRKSFIIVVTIERNKILGYEVKPIYIGKEGIELGRGVTEQELNGYLDVMKSMSESEYEDLRRASRQEWEAPRKSQRDLRWIIKHLRLRYLRLFMNDKRNKKKYAACVSSKL